MSEPAEKKAAISAAEFCETSRTDRAFFFRHALKIRPKTGLKMIPFEMRPGQKKLMDIIDAQRKKGVRPMIVILKARQIGFSTATAMEFLRCCVLWELQHALVTSYKEESCEILFRNIDRAYDSLPKPIKPKPKFRGKRVLEFADNGSRLEVAIAGEVRSFTAQLVHLSELAFIDNAKDLLTAVLQCVPDDPNALIIVESTPNGIGNEFHNLWTLACKPNTDWIPLFIPWFEEPTYRKKPDFTLEELEARTDAPGMRAAEIVRQHGVDLEQIAWWLNKLENDCLGDIDVMEQEYASDSRTCFLASAGGIYDRSGLSHYINLCGLDPEDHDKNAALLDPHTDDQRDHDIAYNPKNKVEPILDRRRAGPLRIYRRPEPRHKYIIAFDIGGGDPKSDPSAGVVLNRHTLNVDAVWHGRTPPELLAFIAAAIGYWYNRGQTFGEGNNQGVLFHHVLLNEVRYSNTYFRKTSEDSTSGRVTDKPGFWTMGQNREHLFNLTRRYVREKAGIVEDVRMVSEWLELKRGDDGRIDHPDGGFSDLTIAFGMALAVHSGGFDSTLTPLPLEAQSAVVSAYEQIRARKAFGQDVSDIDMQGLTVDDADALEKMLEKRERTRIRNGLGGSA